MVHSAPVPVCSLCCVFETSVSSAEHRVTAEVCSESTTSATKTEQDMGMDVFGKDPSAESGQYFRASIWTWPLVHSLTAATCGDLLSDEVLDAMAMNDGAGPDDQETCNEMANRIEPFVKSDMPDPTPANVDLEMLLREWIEFLRHCGGFGVC